MNDYYEDAEIVESTNPRAGLLFIASIVGFFAFLAIIVPIIKANGGSTDSLFFAVIGAVFGAILLPVLLNMALSKLHLKGKSRREVVEAMFGYTPMFPDGDETMMLPSSIVDSFYEGIPDDRALVPYAGFDDDEEFVENEESTVIIEENPMHLADDYQPGVNSFLSACFTLIGIRRSGKSNAVAVIAEELAAWGTPLCIADTEDEYMPLASHKWMPRGILAGSVDLLRVNPELQRAHFIPIDINGAFEFGQTIVAEGLQVVLNLKSFETDDEAAAIMCEIIKGMNAWEESRPTVNRVSAMFILDEAGKWLPQNLGESVLSKDVQLALHKAIFGTMVARGGKRGLGLGLATQRVAQIDKRALQSQWRLLFRQTERGDLAYYAALGLDTDEVPTLRNG